MLARGGQSTALQVRGSTDRCLNAQGEDEHVKPCDSDFQEAAAAHKASPPPAHLSEAGTTLPSLTSRPIIPAQRKEAGP